MDQSELHRLRVQDRAELSQLLTALHGAMNALRRLDHYRVTRPHPRLRRDVPHLRSLPLCPALDPRQETARQLLDGPSGRRSRGRARPFPNA